MTISKEQAMQQGFTYAVFTENGAYTLELLVKPDADLDGDFIAYDLDCNEFIKVNGWLFEVIS